MFNILQIYVFVLVTTCSLNIVFYNCDEIPAENGLLSWLGRSVRKIGLILYYLGIQGLPHVSTMFEVIVLGMAKGQFGFCIPSHI